MMMTLLSGAHSLSTVRVVQNVQFLLHIRGLSAQASWRTTAGLTLHETMWSQQG